jgi:hypothetical protein
MGDHGRLLRPASGSAHGCVRRTAVELVGRRAAAAHPRPDVAECDQGVDRPRARSRRRAAGRRRPARLARRGRDVRPGTGRDRGHADDVAATSPPAGGDPEKTPFRTGGDQKCPQR